MSGLIKREIPLAITFITGIILIGSYFLNIPILSRISSEILTWTNIIAGTMTGLGIINIFMINIRSVQRREEGKWPFALWLMFGIVFMFLFGIQQGLLSGVTVTEAPGYFWVYMNVNIATMITIFSLFGFYVVSATIHAFQVRNLESFLLALGAVIVFLWNAPLGGVIWSGFLPLGSWVSANVTGSTFRAVTITMAVGVLSLGIRILLGMERGYLGVEE